MSRKTIRFSDHWSWLCLEFIIEALRLCYRVLQILIHHDHVKVILKCHFKICLEDSPRQAIGTLGSPVDKPLAKNFHRWDLDEDCKCPVTEIFFQIDAPLHVNIKD